MRSSISSLLPALFLILTITSFAQKRTVSVDAFSKLTFGISGNVYIKQGSKQTIEVECSDKVFDKISFDHSGDELKIKSNESWSWGSGINKSALTIYITMVDINALSVGGSGSIYGDGTIKTGNIGLYVSGSGNIELDLSADELKTRVSGSGQISLTGDAKSLDAHISGSGSVKAQDISVKTVDAAVSGSGSIYIEATEEIKAKISGSGNIYYTGDPKNIDSRTSGSGKVRRR